jgi:Ca2+-transporting ATPase
MTDWYRLETAKVLQQLKTDDSHGLTQEEADQRLSFHGLNELVERRAKSPWLMLWEQLTDTMVVVLLISAAVSALLGDYKDMGAILAIVLFNAILGLNQEYRAAQAFAALNRLAVPTVKVRREDRWQELPAQGLVPGDIILLESGNLVSADCRLLESVNLRVQEAAFTGESEPVEKTIQPIVTLGEPVLGDRHNMAYMGTLIIHGRGRGVVTETGMNTELGKIADLMQTVEPEPTPLQQRLDQLGKQLAIATIALVVFIFILGVLRGETLHLMLLTSVSVGVAVIPEGLPAVVTIALALGAQRMLKRNALIRKLPAVETLGSVTVICADKTGTLTQNRMTVTVLDITGQRVNLADLSLHTKVLVPDTVRSPTATVTNQVLQPTINLLLTGSALCNDALLTALNAQTGSETLGDPTEAALVVAAAQLGLHKSDLEASLPRIAELPFDPDRKRMTTIHARKPLLAEFDAAKQPIPDSLLSSPYIAFTKGAVSSLLEICSHLWVGDRSEPIVAKDKEELLATNSQLAQMGSRVLGVAFRLLDALPSHEMNGSIEQNLTFVGLVGMLDPPRPEVKIAVQTCQMAGVRPVMITGDHPLTAQHIAHELGIVTNGHSLTGKELTELELPELKNHVESVSVYARVSPQQKLTIVQALQEQGHIVAMTGDGVNDAPALRKADIGVAMGLTGTDVAKEAADIVLLDDNFATIVAAVEEGRVIYDNIRKFIKYSMTGNASGLWIMLLAPLTAMPLPLLPLQILWINLLADGLLALALSVEPAERNTMHRPPYHPNENIFDRGVGRDILWVGLSLGLAILLMGYDYWDEGASNWQTIIFATLAFSRMSLALAMRSERDSLFSIGLLTNKPILVAVVLTFLLQLVVIYLPWLQDVFQTTALSAKDLGLSLGVSTVGFWAVEIEKWVIRQGKVLQTMRSP